MNGKVDTMSEKLNEGLAFAAAAHNGQMRKMGNIPYILHPMEVAAIIAGITDDQDVMIAGLLHDTVEDCGVDPKTIKEKFGAKVAALVQSETEDKMSSRPAADTWMARKEESLLMLRLTRDRNVKILWLADKLSNMRSFYREYLKKGDRLWEALHQKDPRMQEWYYRTIATYLMELADTAAYQEYLELVNKIFSGS